MKYINFKRYKFSTILKYIEFKRFNFFKYFKILDIRRYNYSKIFKLIDFRKINISRIYKQTYLKKFKYIISYFTASTLVVAIIYLTIPLFFNYDKKGIESLLCKDFKFSCSIQGKINYDIFPSPRLKLPNVIIKELNDTKTNLAIVEAVYLKLTISNLLDPKKITYNKLILKDLNLKLNFEKINDYKKLFKNQTNFKPVYLASGKIEFLEKQKKVAVLENIKSKFKQKNNIITLDLKGNFLGDILSINYEFDKNKANPLNVIILKLEDLNLFAKIDFSKLKKEKDVVSGKILFKLYKNRLTSLFEYKSSQINLEDGKLRNTFVDGKFNGSLSFHPYFNFNLDVNLNGFNFIKFFNIFTNLDERSRRNFFRINERINGNLNLNVDKIYSKYDLISSAESRIKFINGNISIEQFLLNLGKIGAADFVGLVKNDEKYSSLKFENNIFIDNLKRFYSKFGIYNKEKISSNLYVKGNFDLLKLRMRFEEISNETKLSDEDLNYVEKEFNEILLNNGYVDLFNFLKLKKFAKSILTETN